MADLFQSNGREYNIACADRLTGWTEIAYFPTAAKSSAIIDVIRDIFHRFGVLEELSLDGGPNLMSKDFSNFLQQWGVSRRLSSAYYPQSNGCAELAVKTMKRLIRGNTGKGGNINTNEIAQALLQYRNTPMKRLHKSPAQLLLGRKLWDCIPQPESGYKVSNHWQYFLRLREIDMDNNNAIAKSYYDMKSKVHNTLKCGTAGGLSETLVIKSGTKFGQYESGGTFFIGFIIEYLAKLNAIILMCSMLSVNFRSLPLRGSD